MARDREQCEKLKQIKEASGLSYAEIARITGLSADMIQKYVLGYRIPSEFQVNAIKMMLENARN